MELGKSVGVDGMVAGGHVNLLDRGQSGGRG